MPTEYCIYLRKSRQDLEAEARGEGDTLARHERILMRHAQQHLLPIGAIYRELASGERIASRPVMQQLLTEVEDGRWRGVLVTETSRLARGDTIDQGIVAQSFKFSGTLIVTPQKTYDPSNEIDEDIVEMGLFLSRQEYRMIRRRQVAGRVAATREGRFTGNRAPYGYRRVRLPRGWTLEPEPDEAPFVRLIYDLRAGGWGYQRIANHLSDLQVPTRTGAAWMPATIRDILSNPHYAGYTASPRRPAKKKASAGDIAVTRPRAQDVELYEGLHDAIVDRALWHSLNDPQQQIYNARLPHRFALSNPLAGLLVCSCCGKRMVRRPATGGAFYDTYLCPTRGCPTVSQSCESVEQLLIQSLQAFLRNLELQAPDKKPDLSGDQAALRSVEEQLSGIDARIRKTFDLVEDGTYTKEIFTARQAELSQKRLGLVAAQHKIQARLNRAAEEYRASMQLAPSVRHVLDVYDPASSPQERNDLLKTVIDHIDYNKTTKTKKFAQSTLTLTIHPKIHHTDN